MNDIKQLKEDSSIVDVVSNYVHLEKQGIHHKGLCPFHEDTKPTLTVTESKNKYKCFACGSGGDQFDFLIAMGRTMPEAIDEIKLGMGVLDINPIKINVPKKTETIWKVKYPFPELNGFKHYKFGTPTKIWTYNDVEGNALQHVFRFDLPDGSKQVLPLVWAQNETTCDWRWMALEKPRPIYNLDLLNKFPYASILVVEGEKTAQHGQEHIDPSKVIVTTWIGGANGIKNVDWSPLKDRRIIYCPDHDTKQRYGDSHKSAGKLKPWYEQPGNHAMLEINKLISTDLNITDSRWVNVPNTFDDKWDIADKDWNEGELLQFIYGNITDVPVINTEDQESDDNLKPFTPPIVISEHHDETPTKMHGVDNLGKVNVFENDHFRFLGYDKDENGKLIYFFFSFDAKTVIKLAPSSMTKSNLMMLGPINWWENFFPGRTGLNIDAAQQYLISYSHTCGIFKEKSIRGRGAWIDNKRFVVHTGNTLIVDGEFIPLRKFESKYVYEINDQLDFSIGQKMSTTAGRQIIDMISSLRWEREVNAYLLAGWCVISPFCGVLPWRPHIWVTGPAGSGKSWTMEHVVKKLVGEIGVVMQGKTTEAYVRGKLQNDALPVLFDESDVDSHNDKERVQSVLALARSSSYGNGGVVGKGTQSGGSKEYQIRSCFAFSSIGVQLNQQSDRSRFTMLGLRSFEGFKSDSDFAAFHDQWNSIVNNDLVKSLHSRTMFLLPTILKNMKTFTDAVTQVIGNRRIGDQVGGMLAGAYSLISNNEITLVDAIEWVKKRDWNEEQSLEQTKDEYQLFGRIMSQVTFVDSNYGRVDRTIGELVSLACNRSSEVGISFDTANSRLRRFGIIITNEKIIISNSSPEILNIIKDSSWSRNYNKILERLPSSEKMESRTFTPGLKSRGIALPISLIFD